MKLTSAQKQLYNMEIFAGGSIGVICGTVLFDKVYDINEMKRAINEVYRINEALRTRVSSENGEPVQYVTEYAERDVEVLHFDTKEQVHEYADKMAHTPFDFTGNLCELDILMSESFCGVIYRLHHIISDGWTLALIASQFYKILHGEEVEAFPYSAYIDEEAKYLQSKRAAKDRAYFEEQNKSLDEPLYLFDVAPKIGKSVRKSYIIDKATASKITEFVEKENTSAYMFFLTLITAYFSKAKNNAERFCIGTAILNRTTHSQRNTAGLFVNTVPLFCCIEPESSFSANLKITEENTLGLLRHQKFNYSEMLTEFAEDRLFDILFSYQNNIIYGDHSLSTWYHNGMQNESLQIHIDDRDRDGVFRIHYDYQTEKFEEKDIQRLHERLMLMIDDILEDGGKPLCRLEYLPKEEKQKLLFDFNDTAVDYPKDKGVYGLFEAQVKKTPDKTAVIFKDIKLTYSQLSYRVNECADRLRSLNIKEKDVVAVHLERSHFLIVFQLAVLKTGAIFLPVDKRYPVDRIRQMCCNCNVKLLISDELSRDDIDVNLISADGFAAAEITGKAETVNNMGDCYIIYTSGSTGVPKGCLLTGKGLLNFCLNNNTLETLNNMENPVFACVNSVSFDYFIAETLLPLSNGFTTVVLDDSESTVQKAFLSVVSENGINVIMTTPTRLKIYYDNKNNCDILKNTECICTSGEPLTAELLDSLYKKSPLAQVYNPIGPSECSVWDMGGRLERADGLDIHIGKPVANIQIYITDKYMNLTPIGITGEICIAGDGVGSGYINNPELTSEKFVDNPFGEGKIYKTGDLAYWRDDGNICYVGRNDFQVKIRGQRIELGEIENAVLSTDGVVQCAVVVRKDADNRQFICAFYTGREIDASELRAVLSAKLPRYMVPHIFTHLADMPMTSSGKISRNALPEIELNNISTDMEYAAPLTLHEKVLAEVICSVLKSDSVNMLDNFFNIGGDSISAIYIVSELEEKGYRLHVSDIMQSNTLSDVAKAMKSESVIEEYEQGEVNGFIPFTPIMRAFSAESSSIPEDFVHTCVIPADCDESTAKKVMDVLVAHHDILRGTFTDDGIEIHPSAERKAYSFTSVCIEDEEKAMEFLKKPSIEDGKLVNAVFCRTANGNLIGITVHHFLIDLVSWEVIMKDFKTAVAMLKNNEEASLQSKTASFVLWAEALREYSGSISEESRKYKNTVDGLLDNAKPLYLNGEKQEAAEEFSYTFDESVSYSLSNKVNNTYGTRINEVLLTALGLAAGELADSPVGIMVETHGRAELHKPIATERTVGWFTSCYPVVIDKSNGISDELISVKETLRKIQRTGIDYLLLSQKLHKNADIIFNFYKSGGADKSDGADFSAFNAEKSVFPGKINVNCFIIDDALTVKISVPEGRHIQNIGKMLGEEFIKQVGRLVELCISTDNVIKTRSDFSDKELTDGELEELKTLFDDAENGQNIVDIYGLTPSQEGMYAQYFRNTETKTYLIKNLCKISKNADTALIGKSVELLSLRHQALKTAFAVTKTTGTIKQVVLENRKPYFSVIECAEPYSQTALDKIVAESTKNPFDLQKDSLFRVVIIDFTDERFMLIYAHHIILDGWCFPVIITDLQEYYYRLFNGGKGAEALAEEIKKEALSQTSYGQYSDWIKQQDKNRAYEYWRDLLRDNSPAHIFGKEKKDNSKNENIVTFRTRLTDDLSRYIERFAKENKVSPNTVFECVFSIALQKFSGSEEVVFDKIISGRSIPLKNIECTVGPFINTVPVRIKSDGSTSFSELLRETHNQTVNANKYGILPLSEVYKTCDIDAKAIDSLFVFENYYLGDISDLGKGSLSPELVSFEEQTEFSLAVTILKENHGYTIRTSYAQEMYNEREISSFIEGYLSLLTTSLNGDIQIKDIDAVSDDEKQKVLRSFNNTPYTYKESENSTLYSLFEKTSEENGEKVCIKANGEEITFAEFRRYAERIDSRIREITNGTKSVVAVICERSFEMYGAVYGIIRGGNAYLPIDPKYPQDRIDYILKNSNAAAVITQEKFTSLVKNIPCIDATALLRSAEQPQKTEILALPEDTAYVIYTSGSTGNPKGAKISHKSAVNRILWMHEFYPLEKEDVILQKTPYTFDVSVWELFWWGLKGGSLAVSKPDEHFLPAKILLEAEKNGVTHLHFVPSVFDLFLTYLENNPHEQSRFETVRYVFLSGEALTANHIARFYKIFDFNKVQLHNLYGPTECAVDVSYYPCVPGDVDPVPIGKPIYNTQLYITDKYMNPVPVGVVGELCIAGVNVGQGYLNNPELTAEKFIDNPFGEGKIYKTGDLAYWRDDGNICYVGRMDGQIKLNGQRVELGEIEKEICRYNGVESAAVMIRKNNSNDVIVAFCCGENIDVDALRKHCEKWLPAYMVPSGFKLLREMPLNPSGKLDRKALKLIDVSFSDSAEKEMPKNEREKMFCDLFAKILKKNIVGRNENFFALGGTSLDMITALSGDELKGVSAADFIANATPQALAKMILSSAKTEYLQTLYESEKGEKALVLFPFAGGGAEAFAVFTESVKEKAEDTSVYFVRYLHSADECRRAATEIAEILGDKKVYFYSHCVGSAVALQILNILDETGNGFVRALIAGASIPMKKPGKKNAWNYVPDFVLKKILVKAGAPLDKMPKGDAADMLYRFRKDVDFSTAYFFGSKVKTSTAVYPVIAANDIFTKNYREAELLWNRYSVKTETLRVIESPSHYFQADNSDELAEIVSEIMK